MYPTLLRNTDRAKASTRPDVPFEADDMNLPPPALGLSLLEIYFSRVYHAPIVFHKPALFQGYLSDSIPEYLLKALFAVATMSATSWLVSSYLLTVDRFLDSERGGATKSTKLFELSALGMYRKYGPSWAAS